MADFDSAQAPALVVADSQLKRFDSAQAEVLVAASNQDKYLDCAQSVVLVISARTSATRKQSIVIVAN